MVNKKGGKGYKKSKKGGNQPPKFEVAEEGQTYAKIVKKLGDRRFRIMVHNTKSISIGRARGSLKSAHNLKPDDVVLVSNRDFRQNEKDSFVQDVYDIIGIYAPEHIRKLKKMGEITDSTFGEEKEDRTDGIDFDEEEEDFEEFEVMPQRNLEMPDSDSESDSEDIDINDI